jgi:hypothetical protein
MLLAKRIRDGTSRIFVIQKKGCNRTGNDRCKKVTETEVNARHRKNADFDAPVGNAPPSMTACPNPLIRSGTAKRRECCPIRSAYVHNLLTIMNATASLDESSRGHMPAGKPFPTEFGSILGLIR